MSTNTNTTSGSGGGFGSKIKGAAQVIHGFGDNIRGTALGAADRASRSEAGEMKHEELAAKGRNEIAEGMAKIKGHPPRSAGTTQSTAGEQAAGAGPTGQGQQTEKGGAYSGSETTGSGAAQTGHEGLSREAATGAGEQKKQEQRDPGFARKGYDQDIQERSRATGGQINFQGIPLDDP